MGRYAWTERQWHGSENKIKWNGVELIRMNEWINEWMNEWNDSNAWNAWNEMNEMLEMKWD